MGVGLGVRVGATVGLGVRVRVRFGVRASVLPVCVWAALLLIRRLVDVTLRVPDTRVDDTRNPLVVPGV